MAGYPKIWTTIENEKWWQGGDLSTRGVITQLILWCKKDGDSGHLEFRSWRFLAERLACHRDTCSKIVSNLATSGFLKLTEREDGTLHIHIPKYLKSQRAKSHADLSPNTDESGQICRNLSPKAEQPEQPVSSHTELVAFFCDHYERAIKSKYPFTGKDAKKLSDLLRTYGLDQAKQIIDLYLTDRDDFLTKTGHTTGVLSTRAARYAERLTATQTGRNPDVPY